MRVAKDGETEHFWYRRGPKDLYIDSQRDNRAFAFRKGVILLSEDNGKTWSEPRRIADPLTIGYTLLAATGPDSCLVISRRLQIPGESPESVAQKWRDEWPEWKDKSHVALEARLIRTASPIGGSRKRFSGLVRTGPKKANQKNASKSKQQSGSEKP